MMLAVELIIVLLAIFLGARLGGIGIGFAGGLGVLVLALMGVKPGSIPFDVISIVMAVIAAISTMQVAGGMDFLVQQTEKLLRKNPRHITVLAPVVTYILTLFAGTGNISLSAFPVCAAGDCRGGERAGHQTLAAAIYRRGIRPDRHYRFADFCRRCLYDFGYGRARGELPEHVGGGYSFYFLRHTVDGAAGELAV